MAPNDFYNSTKYEWYHCHKYEWWKLLDFVEDRRLKEDDRYMPSTRITLRRYYKEIFDRGEQQHTIFGVFFDGWPVMICVEDCDYRNSVVTNLGHYRAMIEYIVSLQINEPSSDSSEREWPVDQEISWLDVEIGKGVAQCLS